ncbi:WD40 repeat-like protein [Rhizoctonia solani]|uniref:WD40 repeat-like protein n=1 Tax=Rhizoctonia solani TaxID=456999 RepID=A0A8H7I919_9AGAM|nr:WD40 repeat-like protein [Rhizoctonia solani]
MERFRVYVERKKKKLKEKFMPATSLNVSISTPSIGLGTNTLYTETATSRLHSTAHENIVLGGSSSQISDTNQSAPEIGPLHDIHSATEAAASRSLPASGSKSLALTTLSTALKTLQSGAEVFPPLRAAIGGLVACIERIELSSKHRNEFEDLASSLTSLSISLHRHLKESRSNQVSEFLEQMAASRQDRGAGGYFRQAEEDEDEILRGYKRIAEILAQLQAEANLKMWNTVEGQLADSRIDALSPVDSATYNSLLSHEVNRRACTKETRVQILLDLEKWSLDPSQPNIFWMNGMAGTGKTTIAYTFAESLKTRGALGGSFFCTRTSDECRDVGRIVPTIAHQLSQYSPSFRSALCKFWNKNPRSDRSRSTQHKWGRNILSALFRVAPNLPIRFFITSRPEPDIRLRVDAQSQQSRSICILHDMEKSLVQADIHLYLREELANSVSEHDLSQLAKLSKREYGRPDRLETVLNSSSNVGYQHTDIDRLYTTILDAAMDDPEHEPKEQEQMRLILWTAVCTREPVTIDTLAALAGIKPAKANVLLQSLYRAARIAGHQHGLTSMHPSPTTSLTKSASKRFYCDETTHSQLLS